MVRDQLPRDVVNLYPQLFKMLSGFFCILTVMVTVDVVVVVVVTVVFIR